MSELTPEEFWSILHSSPEPVAVFYRLYYDDLGAPIIYSMESLSGNYIDVDPDIYALAPFNVRVVDGKLTYITPKFNVSKLQPTESHGVACSPCDVCVIVTVDQPHIKWNTVTNEIN